MDIPMGSPGRGPSEERRRLSAQALQDANAALRLSAACEPALYRKGLACFELDEFETALEAFKAGEAPRGTVRRLLNRRSNATGRSRRELAGIGPRTTGARRRNQRAWARSRREQRGTGAFLKILATFPRAGETAADAELRDLRKYAMWIRKCEAEIEDDDDDDDSEEDVAEVEAGTDAAPSTPAPPIASAPALESGVRVVPCTVKYQYYQTSTHLTITVRARAVAKRSSRRIAAGARPRSSRGGSRWRRHPRSSRGGSRGRDADIPRADEGRRPLINERKSSHWMVWARGLRGADRGGATWIFREGVENTLGPARPSGSRRAGPRAAFNGGGHVY